MHAYFFLANSYDNLYKPARKGEAENDALLTKAIENYKLAAEKETDPKMKKLSLDYLVAAYGPDKLDDPTRPSHRAADDPARSERHDELLRPRARFTRTPATSTRPKPCS